jgi:trehalose-6-phosphate synthase
MIHRALEMQPEERRSRMTHMRRTVKEHNVYRWEADLISDLSEIRLDSPEPVEVR